MIAQDNRKLAAQTNLIIDLTRDLLMYMTACFYNREAIGTKNNMQHWIILWGGTVTLEAG